MQKLRCIHRHTIEEHPSCFVKGLVKDSDKASLPWFMRDGSKIGYLDIETDGLKADFSTLLTWCIKEKGGKVHSDVITKKEIFSEKDVDKRLVESIVNKIKEFKIIVTYYGTKFDIAYIRTKAIRYGIEFPAYYIYTDVTKGGREIIRITPEVIHWDLYYTVRQKLNLSSKSLANSCDYFGIKGKTPIEKDIWRQAKYGNPKALSVVLSHNVADVEILEKLHDKMIRFAKWEKKGM